MHHDKKLYGTVSVGTKGQVVIPVEAREAFNIKTGDRLYVVGAPQHGWVGLLKEEQMQDVIDHLTEKLESLRELVPRKTRNK